MTNVSLFIRHRAKPGRRDEVRRIWEKHFPANIGPKTGHLAYVYCYDEGDPDTILVFQRYADRSGLRAFTKTEWYARYEREAAPLLTDESEFRIASPQWTYDAAEQER